MIEFVWVPIQAARWHKAPGGLSHPILASYNILLPGDEAIETIGWKLVVAIDEQDCVHAEAKSIPNNSVVITINVSILSK
jgi:hypothetical protein